MADLGVGNGYFTIPLAEITKTAVYAVDIEPEMLELLKKRANEANSSLIQYVVSDLEKVKLDNNSVDKAIVSLVLHEVPQLPKALTEIKRILTRDGQLFILRMGNCGIRNGTSFTTKEYHLTYDRVVRKIDKSI